MSTPTYTPPIISVQEDPESGEYVLMATSHMRTMPAGSRLFRAQPWPAIAFSAPTQEEAEKHAETLRAYLANPPKRTRKTSEEAVSERSEALEKPVWNL